jgi:hypothetical protein
MSSLEIYLTPCGTIGRVPESGYLPSHGSMRRFQNTCNNSRVVLLI